MMIASNNILPPPGDPGALSRLIMDYRNQRQREAAVNQEMQFDQNRNQGVLIQNQMAQVQLDEFNNNAPTRARQEEAAAALAETQAETAAKELLGLQRKNGILGKFVDGAFMAAQNLAKMRQIQQAAQAAQLSADMKLRKDAFALLTNENTGEIFERIFFDNPEEAAKTTGLPVAVLRPLVAQASNARKMVAAENVRKKEADEIENAKKTPAGQVEFAVRSAAKAGNFTQASAIVRQYLLTFPGFNQQIAETRGDQAEMVRIYDAHVFSYFEALGLGDQARQYFAERAKAANPGTPTAGGTPAAAPNPRIKPLPAPAAATDPNSPPMGIHEETGETIIFLNGEWVTYIPPR